MKGKTSKALSILLVILMVISLLPMTVFAEEEEIVDNDAITLDYGNYTFTKISNPATGSEEPDGINTNDITGYEPNRLNSYAWAVVTRGDYIYIGTNRTLFGSALNAVTEQIHAQNPNITEEMMGNIVSVISGYEVPVNLKEDDYIPQIIKFDIKNGSTEVIYQPNTARGEDGKLYYTDKDGNIIPTADVSSETASFRSVVQFNGNLYFGSLGVNMLQLVRVDEEDNAKVVFQTIGLTSSLRACCIYDDGDGDTVYFGGQDTTNLEWLVYRQEHPGVLPIVIRRLDPETAGEDNEDWSDVVADFKDFGKYAYAKVYAAGGGNVWDLCNYNGKMYLILAYDGGWAMFRGEKGGDKPNDYGWTWTEIVGDDSIYGYPLAMDEEVSKLNEEYREAYSCNEFAPNLMGAGLLESTATPYVYNGKMYIGSFDNATTIQSETVIKALTKLQYMTNTEDLTNMGPSLSQIFAPIYEVLSHPQHVWVMDEDENISAVENANELLAGTTNDYVWRFVEHDGKLYTGTFDSSTAYNYFLDFPMRRLLKILEANGIEIPEEIKDLMDGSFLDRLLELLNGNRTRGAKKSETVETLDNAATNACVSLQDFFNGDTSVEKLLNDMSELEDVRNAVSKKAIVSNDSKMHSLARAMDDEDPTIEADKEGDEGDEDGETLVIPEIPEEAMAMIDWLLKTIDVEGLGYWAQARSLAKNAESGFDIFVTEDGDSWEEVVRDGLEDPFNYGARTFTICNDELYVGTANPYYGAQLWKVENQPSYTVTVKYGKADLNEAKEGDIVTITTDKRSGYTFKKWEVQSGDLELMDETAKETTFIMPAEDVTIEATFTKKDSDDDSSVIPEEEKEHECPSKDFTDFDPDAWYHEAVDYVVANGLMNGVDNNKFDPNGTTTRAMIVTILYRLEGNPAITKESPFDDVAEGQWYTDAVIWANENGIVEGYGGGKFGPTNDITREQFAAILYRYAQFKGYDVSVGEDTNVLSFNDAFDISDWAMPAIQWACGAGLMQGDNQGNLLPGDSTTRAQAAALIMRFIENVK